MSNIADFNAASVAETDREHALQLGLLQALCNAVRDHRDAVSVALILSELIDYSEAHFVSEELAMRQKSYDDFEDHVEDHVRMLEVLREIAADHAAGQSDLVLGKAEQVLGFISQHIDTRDRRFSQYVRTGQ